VLICVFITYLFVSLLIIYIILIIYLLFLICTTANHNKAISLVGTSNIDLLHASVEIVTLQRNKEKRHCCAVIASKGDKSPTTRSSKGDKTSGVVRKGVASSGGLLANQNCEHLAGCKKK
jgi:competence protein ComGC